jgi:hypothetical protein
MTTYINGTTGATANTLVSTGTGALTLPVGTTVQRPTPVLGMIRFNTTTSLTEIYNGTSWGQL